MAKLSFLKTCSRGCVSTLAVRSKSSTVDSSRLPVKNRTKRPMHPFRHFRIERLGMSEVSEEAAERRKEMTDEERRPFVEESGAVSERWPDGSISEMTSGVAESALLDNKHPRENALFCSLKRNHTIPIAVLKLCYEFYMCITCFPGCRFPVSLVFVLVSL